MHRRNQSVEKLSGGGGFSYGTTPPLSQPPPPTSQQKPKYDRHHQSTPSDFRQSTESLHFQHQQPGHDITPTSSTTTLPQLQQQPRAQTYPRSSVASGSTQYQRDSYFPPTPPGSIRVSSPVGTRGHVHSPSQHSLTSTISNSGGVGPRGPAPLSLNGLFSSQGGQGGKKPKSAAASLRSRFTFSLGGGSSSSNTNSHNHSNGGVNANSGAYQHGKQGSTAMGTALPQQHQQQQYPMQREETPLPVPSPPPVRMREYMDQEQRRQSVNSVHSELGVRPPTSPEESAAAHYSSDTWKEETSGIKRSGTLCTVMTGRSIVYDEDVDISQLGDLIGTPGSNDSDSGGDTPTSITPSLFLLNRKQLEGTGIATGESTMLGEAMVVDGRLVKVSGGSAITIGSNADSATNAAESPVQPNENNNSDSNSNSTFLSVEDSPLSPLRPLSMLPQSPASSLPGDNTLAAGVIKRTPSSASLPVGQVKRKPSPVTSPFAPPQTDSATAPFSAVSMSQNPNIMLSSPTQNKAFPETQPPINTITATSSASSAFPHNPITSTITSPLTKSPVPVTWGGQALKMEISQVELPPPPQHQRSTNPDSPLAMYAMERQKKLIDEEWEDLENEAAEDNPPPPYVARMSMMPNGGNEEREEVEDEKARLKQMDAMANRGGVNGVVMRQSLLTSEQAEREEGGRGSPQDEGVPVDDEAKARAPMTGLSTGRTEVLRTESYSKEEASKAQDYKGNDNIAQDEAGKGNGKDGSQSTESFKTKSSPATPTLGRKQTILKTSGAGGPGNKFSPGLHRSGTRSKIRFSHTAPEVVTSEQNAEIAAPEVTGAATTTVGGKACKTCKANKGLANKYRDLLTRERGSFALERSIWEDERKAYERKIRQLEKRIRKLVEVVAQGDEGAEEEDGGGDEIDEEGMDGTGALANGKDGAALEEEEDEKPILSATGGLNLGGSASGGWKLRDTGKEVDRSNRREREWEGGLRDHSGGAWPRQQNSRPPTTMERNRSSDDRYWSDFLDEHRYTSRCATIPPALISENSNSQSYYTAAAAASSSAGPSSYSQSSRTWGGSASASWAGATGSASGENVSRSARNGGNTGGGSARSTRSTSSWADEAMEIDPRVRLPITEERAVYARLYAEASIGIGGPSGDLLH